MVRVIGVFKLAKVVALIAIGAGALTHVQHDVAAHLRGLLSSEYVRRLLSKLDRTSNGDVDKLGLAALTYAGLFAAEGVGLLARKVWGEWLTIVITGSFIPFEIYEMVEKRSAIKAIVIALNVAIVIYLLVRRLRHRGYSSVRLKSIV